MNIFYELLTLVLTTSLTKASRFVTPFGLNTPGPKTILRPEFQHAVYRPTYNMTLPSVRSQKFYKFPVPEKDSGPVKAFDNTDGRQDFLRLLKYMIPLPSSPIKAPSPDILGGNVGLGGPMGPMSPGMLSTKYGNIIVSGPMDVSEFKLSASKHGQIIADPLKSFNKTMQQKSLESS